MQTTRNWYDLSRYALLGIGMGLIAIHLTLTFRNDNVNLLGISLLCWGVVASLIWEKRETLKLKSSLFSSVLAIGLLSAVLLKTTTTPTSNFLGVSPFVSGLGLALLASGFFGLKQYWRELLILFFLGVPKVLLWPVLDISIITAKVSSFMLWYTGFDVARFGTKIALPSGIVNVNMGCSGFDTMFHLLSLAVLFLILFPLKGWKRWCVPLMAITIAFLVNAVRVALMAILVNASQDNAFKYWHTGDGSLIFSLLAVCLFGGVCYLLLQSKSSQSTANS